MTDADIIVELNKLRLRRKVSLQRLSEIYNYAVNNTDDQFYKQNLFARLEFVDSIHDEFREYHNSIVSLISTDAEFQLEDKIRSLADKYVYDVKGKKFELTLSETAQQETSTQFTSTLTPKLPKINIPVFDGNLKQWPAFYDLFNSVIHTNPTLSDIEKFHYLTTSLKADALNLIKSIPLTAPNYQIAYDALKTRFQNKRVLATAYFNEIYLTQPIFKPTAKDIRRLIDTFSENLASLRGLNFDTNSWDFIIFNILLQKLDTKTRMDFEIEHSTVEFPTYAMLSTFLNNQCKALESVEFMTPASKGKSEVANQNPRSKCQFKDTHRTDVLFNNNVLDKGQQNAVDRKCPLCTASHALYRCSLFLAKSPHERLALVKSHNLCVNCMRSRHTVRNCLSTVRCKMCNLQHHTLLHLGSPRIYNQNSGTSQSSFFHGPQASNNLADAAQNSDGVQNSQTASTASALSCTSPFGHQRSILLSTAIVEILDAFGNYQKARILLDTASMANFISERCANRLGLKRYPCSTPLEGINNQISNPTYGKAHCIIKPFGKSEPGFEFEAILLPKVCSDQPKMVIDTTNWQHIQDLPLADPQFQIPSSIDILLGAELVPYILRSGQIFGHAGQPVALRTIFGWILQGPAGNVPSNSSLVSCHVSLNPHMELALKKFWELEEVPTSRKLLSPDEQRCESIYTSLLTRDASGRFIVPLPFKHQDPNFGDTYSQALRRFTYLESRLHKNPELHLKYVHFIKEYIEKEYISEVSTSDYQSKTAFYLPHHCVLKPDSVSTKLRVVFDASAKGTAGLSLNDTLFAGPKLHQNLSSILLRFRIYPYVFVCDIKQMYCQILIKPEYRKYQRFLWRFSTDESIKEYHLNRVTFGVSSAPYLALRTLKELAAFERNNHPLAAKVLDESVYVDDCVAGAESVKDILKLQQELISLLEKGGFELRKWASNCSELLSAVKAIDPQMPLTFDSDGPNFVKVLGLQWHPQNDIFSYCYTPINVPCTKRNILSQIARIFDPVGFLSPMIFLAKRILQLLWLSKSDWDEIPSHEIVKTWEKITSELSEISKIRIPRLMSCLGSTTRVEVHGFCDASSCGYGCAVYFRSISSNGQTECSLVAGKSRVSPLKIVSLPRLELCAAYLLADLLTFVISSYEKLLTIDAVYAWSDSQVTLAWILSSPHRWKTFVANRVARIQELIPSSSWKYVPTDLNPADCASRGLTPLELFEHKLWWKGPEFLTHPCHMWPTQRSVVSDGTPETSSEEKQLSLHVTKADSSILTDLLFKFSSLRKVQRVLACVLTFISRTRRQISSFQETIPKDAMQRSMVLLLLHAQEESFSNILQNCRNNSPLPKPFRKLAPFIDEVGLLRVGGRLRNSSLSIDAKFPVLLPKNHRLCELIIEQSHNDNFHPGMKTLHNLIIQNFWILSPRSAIYRCLSRCIKCFRMKPRSYAPFMADLPSFRLTQVKAFSQVCLDYAGPFSITMGRYRGGKPTKAYICLFVCCSTKAIHLELSSDLSSDTFLAAFRRFMARRGRVSEIHSDQGTNFKGAYNQLLAFSQMACKELSIKWHFNPPGAPHFNGLSEAGVKSVKSHLYRVTGEQILTYEEFYTLLTQIECLLNSRPLSPISDDPNDLSPLTPGHFLTMEPLTGFPEPDVTHIPLNRLDRWQLLQKMHVDFWKRWNQDYLHTLQQRSKWLTRLPNIKPNTLVLIKDERTPPKQWVLGRVIKVHPGADGTVRVVTLKVQGGLLQRPVVKLCPLPGQ